MLKELASLLCSLFVPKRAVNGGGGDSSTIYGVGAGALGTEDPTSEPIKITLEDGFSVFDYVAPYDCLVTVFSLEPVPGFDDHYVYLNLKNRDFRQLVRSHAYNIATTIRVARGQVVTAGARGNRNQLIIRKVLPN